jgi:hypothetical protein
VPTEKERSDLLASLNQAEAEIAAASAKRFNRASRRYHPNTATAMAVPMLSTVTTPNASPTGGITGAVRTSTPVNSVTDPISIKRVAMPQNLETNAGRRMVARDLSEPGRIPTAGACSPPPCVSGTRIPVRRKAVPFADHATTLSANAPVLNHRAPSILADLRSITRSCGMPLPRSSEAMAPMMPATCHSLMSRYSSMAVAAR